MASIILKKFSEPEALTSKKDLSPLSYKEWISQNYGISENAESDQYQKYLLSWYGAQKDTDSSSELKEHYKDLLKKLSVVFRDDEEFRKLSTLDLDDDRQLKIALPYYVKKIKEIALYYRDRRESVKRAKLKYNMIGSSNAVEKTFYEYILKAFSKKEYVLNVPSQENWNMFPELSSINTGFSIKIEEVYDDTDYYIEDVDGYSYQQGSENPLTYILDDILESQYGSTQLDEISLSAFQIPLDVDHGYSDLNFHSINIANEKYAGANRYLLSGGHFIDDLRNVSLNITQGDNFFYWFSGEYFREAPSIHYEPTNINDLDWFEAGAVAGDTISSSDRVFVNYNGEVKGAWLSRINDVVVGDTMSVNIKNNRVFKYPYPGIGISAEGFEWTGKQVKDYEFYNKAFFPDQTQRNLTLAKLESMYWTDMDSISTVVPISIHDTTLIDSGAYPHKKFHMADKIVTRSFTSDGVHDENSDGIYRGELNVDWLYDFTNTQLPISAGENKIFWPFQVYSDSTEIIFNKSTAESMYLRDIPMGKFSGAVAGNSPDTSDMIFKRESRCGDVTEAAWLMGHPLSALYNECNYEEGELVLESSGVIPEQIPFSPWSIPTLKHWWIIENAGRKKKAMKNAAGKRVTPTFFTRWVDSVSRSPITIDDRQDKPRYDIVGKEISINTSARDFVTSDGLEGLYWDAKPVGAPYTICMAFKPHKRNNVHTLFETNTRDKREIRVVIRDNGRVVASTHDNKNRIASSQVVGLNTWSYLILVVNSGNSKLILNGVEVSGALNLVPLRRVLFGIGRNDGNKRVREFQGDIRDIVVFNSALSVDELSKMKGYMSNLTFATPVRPTKTPAQLSYEQTNINLVRKEQLAIVTNTATTGDFLSGAMQPSVSFRVDPRTTTRFIWTGSGNLNAEENINDEIYKSFGGHLHDDACPYLNLSEAERISIVSGLANSNQWKLCDCNAIIHSPMGHTGESFKDNSKIGDYIILDSEYPDIVGLDDWRGSDGAGWGESKDFGWFKLDEDQPDGTHGWGKGRWVTNYGEDFHLVAGKMYSYHRSGFSVSCEQLEAEGLSEPFIIINQPICNCQYVGCECEPPISCLPEWRSARFRNGAWEDNGTITNMLMEPLNHYTYLHRDKYKFSTIVGEDEEYIDCIPSVNFLINVELENTSPYWAKGSFGIGPYTKNKSIMYGGENLELVYDYLQISQPEPSNLILVDDMYLEYQRNSECSTDCFVWNEPLKFRVKEEKIVWKKIEVDNCVESDILHHIQNLGCEECERLEKKCNSCCSQEKRCSCIIDNCLSTRVGISASSEDSDIVFYTNYDGSPLFVNYYSIGDFNLNFNIVNTENGVAPTGGVWVEETFINYNLPISPWTNIPNVYRSTIARNINPDNLYTNRDCGFFTPSKFGYTVVKLNDKKIELVNYEERSLSSVDIVLDTDHYTSGPYSVTYINSDWMKYKTQCAGGNIKNAVENQEFSPYQSFYENNRINVFGIQNQEDVTIPWVGKFKDHVYDTKDYQTSLQGIPNVYCGPTSWLSNQPEISGSMYDWKMDVYGNQYGVYKDIDRVVGIKPKIDTEGKLWIRSSTNEVGGVLEMLPRVIDSNIDNSVLVDDLTGSGVLGIDMFYDTLFVKTPNNIIFEKINIDSSTGEIFSNEIESFVFDISQSDFGGTWLDESTKNVYFGFMDGIYPKIYKISLNSSRLSILFSEETSVFDFNSDVSDRSDPIFSYNEDRNFYNISYHGLYLGDPVLIILNFREEDSPNTLNISDPIMIPIPDVGNKTLIKTALFDDKMMLIFEEVGESTNQIYQISIDNKY